MCEYIANWCLVAVVVIALKKVPKYRVYCRFRCLLAGQQLTVVAAVCIVVAFLVAAANICGTL